MELTEAMEKRHSVRQYESRSIGEAEKQALQEMIAQCNEQSGLHIQLVCDEPKAFGGFMARYGKFSGVGNYIAMIGKKSADLEEKCGYYGEKLVLKAQQLGLNTCWVAMTYSKTKTAFKIDAGEKLCLVIAVGYGKTQGTAHKSKSIQDVVINGGNLPDWFEAGVKAALLAPTAVNQQKFSFGVTGNRVSASAGKGFYSKIDLGIAKYHFEIGAGKDNFEWE